MTCRVALSLLDDFVDHELSPPEALSVREHLDTCPACRMEHEQTVRLKGLLAKAPSLDPGPDYWRELTPLVTAKTIDAEPLHDRVPVETMVRPGRSELLRAIVTCAASLALLTGAVLVGSQHQKQSARLDQPRRPFLVTAPLESILASDRTTLVSTEELRTVARVSFLLGAPGPLGRLVAIPEFHRQ